MAVQYVDITTLTEYTGDDLSGNEPIQVSASAFTTIGGIADFGEKKFGDRPTILEIPNSLFALSESSSSAAISNVINSVASGWNDFMSKVSSANLVYSRTGLAALNQYRIFASTVTSNLTNSVSFYDVANNQLSSRVITYNSSSDTYSIKITNYDLNSIVDDIPSGAFKYQTSNVFDYPKPGDYILGIYSQGTSVINLKASDFLVANNHVCKIVVPAATTKVQIVTDNGIPPLVTDAAWEPSDFGGGTQDRIVYTITAFASNNNPSASQIWFFIDAELYRLRTE
jgi:hypothetical protein|nr:MAG TPA: hypothetical protein [Caudoviricetes sp.]